MSKNARIDDWFGSTRILSSPSRRIGTHLRRSVSAAVRYDPTTSISGAAVPTEKACETTRIAGAAAWGAPVGIGSGVRASVVAVGSAVGASVGVAVGVAVWVGAPVAVGVLPLGVAAGSVHAQITATASASAGHLRIAVIPLRVALGHGSADIHSVSESDRRQSIGLDATTLDRRTQIIEISNHR